MISLINNDKGTIILLGKVYMERYKKNEQF